MEVEKSYCDLFGNFSDATIIKHDFSLMQQVKKTALADELRDHIEKWLGLRVQTHAHVKDNIGMTQLI